MDIVIGLLVPFLGTALGSAMVFILKKELRPNFQKLLLGFASGIMLAASVWSLLIPSLEKATLQYTLPWFPTAIGFLLGIGFLLLLDTIIPHLHRNAEKSEGLKSNVNKNTMLFLAVTLHNIPEGMAVGVLLAGIYTGDSSITLSSALVLAIGIAIQNFPEGTIVSMPLRANGSTRFMSFLYGTMSGAVEPIAGLLTIFLAGIFIPILPYLLAFAAGAMVYVVAEELIPELQEGTHSNVGIIGLSIGFVLMMILDVALG